MDAYVGIEGASVPAVVALGALEGGSVAAGLAVLPLVEADVGPALGDVGAVAALPDADGGAVENDAHLADLPRPAGVQAGVDVAGVLLVVLLLLLVLEGGGGDGEVPRGRLEAEEGAGQVAAVPAARRVEDGREVRDEVRHLRHGQEDAAVARHALDRGSSRRGLLAVVVGCLGGLVGWRKGGEWGRRRLGVEWAGGLDGGRSDEVLLHSRHVVLGSGCVKAHVIGHGGLLLGVPVAEGAFVVEEAGRGPLVVLAMGHEGKLRGGDEGAEVAVGGRRHRLLLHHHGLHPVAELPVLQHLPHLAHLPLAPLAPATREGSEYETIAAGHKKGVLEGECLGGGIGEDVGDVLEGGEEGGRVGCGGGGSGGVGGRGGGGDFGVHESVLLLEGPHHARVRVEGLGAAVLAHHPDPVHLCRPGEPWRREVGGVRESVAHWRRVE